MGMKNAKRASWDKEHIRALRQHLGLTQTEFAARLGTRQQTISEWETGMYKPRGTSSTLLTIVAERAGFDYETGSSKAAKVRPTGQRQQESHLTNVGGQE